MQSARAEGRTHPLDIAPVHSLIRREIEDRAGGDILGGEFLECADGRTGRDRAGQPLEIAAIGIDQFRSVAAAGDAFAVAMGG
ncbi:hypothetical protein D3C71_1832050 [compost metagenome]